MPFGGDQTFVELDRKFRCEISTRRTANFAKLSRIFRIYLDEGIHPIYFEGTEPSRRGFPPPGEQLNVGTPRDRWVESLTPAQWYAYMGLQ